VRPFVDPALPSLADDVDPVASLPDGGGSACTEVEEVSPLPLVAVALEVPLGSEPEMRSVSKASRSFSNWASRLVPSVDVEDDVVPVEDDAVEADELADVAEEASVPLELVEDVPESSARIEERTLATPPSLLEAPDDEPGGGP
jgi:hypothetical protein